MTSLFKITLAVALMTGGTASIAPAQTRSVAVNYADLDLASPHDQVRLATRINRAAHLLCDTTNESFGPAVRRAQDQCRTDIRAQANRAIAERQHMRLAAR